METLTPSLPPPTDPVDVTGPRRSTRAPWVLAAVCICIAVVFAAPLMFLVLGDIGAFRARLDALRLESIAAPLWRTLWLATVVSGACVVLGTTAAWIVTRTDVPLRRTWQVAAAMPLVIPSYVGAFVYVSALGPGGWFPEALGVGFTERIEGFWPSAVVLSLLSYPLVYLPVVARLAALPTSFEESARALGRGPFAVFRTIVFPQIRPAVSAGALLVFLYTVSEFGAVSILQYDTLTVRAYSSALTPDTSMAIASVLAAIALTVVVFERRAARRAQIHAEVSSDRRSLQVSLGWWKVPTLAFLLALVGAALVVPLAVLTRWAFFGTADNGGLGALLEPARNSAVAGVSAAVVAIVVVLPIAYLSMRHRGATSTVTNALVVSGFGLPGLVIALALVRWVRESPDVVFDALYQSFTLLIVAYTIHFGAQALGAAQVAVGAVPTRLDDAARSLGAKRVRRYVRVDFPLTLPGLAAGGGLVLLSVMKELPATLLLAPTGFRTLATRVWSATSEGFYARAGLASLVLVAVSAVLTWFLTIRRMEAMS